MVEMVPFTRQGYDRLSLELGQLKSVERPKIIQEIAEARSHGDLKENAEYHAAREKQSFIESRISVLDDVLARAQIIDIDKTAKLDQVRFGTVVTVEDESSGERKAYQIVGDTEADINNNRISMSSPIAKALMGKKLDDLVEVRVPKGVIEYVIVGIEY